MPECPAIEMEAGSFTVERFHVVHILLKLEIRGTLRHSPAADLTTFWIYPVLPIAMVMRRVCLHGQFYVGLFAD